MAGTRRDTSRDGTTTVKRRGILAAAGAVVAGIVAKQAAPPARADAGTWTLPYSSGSIATSSTLVSLINGGSGMALFGNSTTNIGIYGSTSAPAGQAQAGVFGYGGNSGNYGVQGNSPNGYGVYGFSQSGGSGIGVVGSSYGGHGIYGNCLAPPGSSFAGVVGHGNGSGTFGVLGDGGATATGTGAIGVQGQGAQVGVVGLVNNANNTIGVFGNNLSTGAGGVGIYGSCANGTGVYGQTAASNQYGVLGTTYAPNSTAIAGTCTGNGSSAFSGGTTNPNAYAGVFQGTVVVQGRLIVSDPSYKSGALAHPDGSHRLVYCVESPESWIEDVGTGTLAAGKATVSFDKDFAAVVQTDRYHVFLTSYDPTNKGLAVAARTASGFTVQEQNGGTSGGTFSWKVMVKGKSSVKSERLGKFTMPNLPLPDAAKFKAPDLPPPAMPKKP